MNDWKSTAAGVLSFLITTLTVISALLAGNDLSGGGGVGTVHVETWVVISINGALALCRAWIGLITQNASAPAVAAVINNVKEAGPAVPTVTTADLTATPKP